jgi:hypothetical protein
MKRGHKQVNKMRMRELLLQPLAARPSRWLLNACSCDKCRPNQIWLLHNACLGHLPLWLASGCWAPAHATNVDRTRFGSCFRSFLIDKTRVLIHIWLLNFRPSDKCQLGEISTTQLKSEVAAEQPSPSSSSDKCQSGNTWSWPLPPPPPASDPKA